MVEERFQTTGGSIFTSGSNTGVVSRRGGDNIYKHSGMFDASPYQIEHNELFASIRSGGHINAAHYGAEATMTAIMGRMATYSGKRIEWDKALASGKRLVPDSDQLAWDSNPPVMPLADGSYAIPQPGKTRAY